MTFRFLGGRYWFAVLFALFLILSFSGTLASFAAEKGNISGTVTDEASKTPLPGIAVTVEGTDIIVYTNEKGEYEISLKPGTYKLRAELLGYKPSEALNVTVLEGETTKVNLKMEEALAIKGEEVVVTGERLNIPLSKTTASVAVVSSRDIEKVPVATNAADLLAYTPGVQMESGSSPFTKTIKIRGRTATPPRTASSGILLLVDGIPSNDPASGYANIYQIPSENIERIEVVKGASSAQYGGQAAAGVINIITRKGQTKPYTSAGASFGTFQRRSRAERELYESYTFSHGWGNKYFDYALSVAYAHTSGITSADTNKVGSAYSLFAKSHPGQGRLPDGTKVLLNRREIPFMLGKNVNELFDVGDHDKAERYSASASLGINLFKGNKLRINPSYSFLNSYSIFSPGNIPISIPSETFLQSGLRILNRRDALNIIDKWDITPNLTYNFRMGLIKSTDIADFLFVNDFIDYDKETEAVSGLKDGFVGGGGPFSPAPDFMLNRSFTFANDLSYKFDILDGDTLTIGQEYQWTKSSSPTLSYVQPSVKRNIHSLFFQNMLVIKDLTFSVGGRWDQATTFIDDFDDEFSPRVGFNYEISPGTSFRFSIGRARRFPEFARKFGLAQSNGRSFGNPALDPEINWTYELGFKFSTKYVNGDIAYFYDDYSDFELPVTLQSLGFADGAAYSEQVLGISRAAQAATGKNFEQQRSNTYINGPNVVFQGFDTSVEINPTKDWQISLSYLFQRAIVGNPNPFDFSQGTPQRLFIAADGIPIGPLLEQGNRLEWYPTHIFKVGSGYTFPFDLRVDVEGRFKSTTHFVTAVYPGGTLPQPEHWIWDFKMAQPLFNGKAKLTFSIENVFSKLYFENGGIPSNVARYVWGLETKF